MSQTSASEPTPPERDSSTDAAAESPQPESFPTGPPEGAAQPQPEQPYDELAGAQQYGQPTQQGFEPEFQPGSTAPLTQFGAQQYGQPEPVQGTPEQGYPHQGSGPAPQAYGAQPGYNPIPPGYGPPAGATPGYPQQPYGQQSYAGPQQYGQQPYGQPPQQAYPPAPYPQAQAPLSESDQRLWATLTHISIPFFGFIGPLVAYLVLKDRSEWLKTSVTEALNFSILVSIAILVSSLLTLVIIGYVLLPIVGVATLVLCILAAIASNRGELYRYPLNWRLIK